MGEATCRRPHLNKSGATNYAKAGVILLDLGPDSHEQMELSDWDIELNQTRTASVGHQDERAQLMVAMDSMNQRYGKDTIKVVSAGVNDSPNNWQMRQTRRTPRYTTSWSELAVARV